MKTANTTLRSSMLRSTRMLTILVVALGLMVCQARVSEAAPVGTAFTYQGRLIDANSTADGLYDFSFRLYDANVGGSKAANDVNVGEVDVIDGYFTVELDFGSGVFDGNAIWLEVGIRPGELEDPNVYSILAPRQELTATPYALTTSYSLNTRGIYVDDSNNVSISNISVSGDLSFTDMLNTMYFNSDGVINVGRELSMTSGTTMELVSGAAMNLQSGAAMNLQSSAPMTIITPALNVNAPIDMGDAVTIGGNVGIGTTNPLASLVVAGTGTTMSKIGYKGSYNNVESGRLAFDEDVELSDICGFEFHHDGSVNKLHLNSGCPTMSPIVTFERAGNVGIGTTSPNSKLEVDGVVHSTSGGFKFPDNSTQTSAASGDSHSLDAADGSPTDAVYVDNSGNVGVGTSSPSPNAKLTVNGAILRSGSTMYGSNADTHINLGTSSTTGGAGQDYSYATVSGGYENDANGSYATVGGGRANTASYDYATVCGGYGNKASTLYATVPGGLENSAGQFSFAAGFRAKADHMGCFVWADSTGMPLTSSSSNVWRARASGGVSFYTNFNMTTGARLAAGSGSWSSVSDRNAKDNFAPVDNKEILEKLVEIPIEMWKYKPEADSIRHIGPMAQDLYAAFGFGDSDKAITSIDAEGISFAAIQGLYELVQEKEAEIAVLKERMTAMEGLVARLARFQQGGAK